MTIGTKLAKNEIHAPLELSGLTVTSVSALSAASVISLIEVSLGRATAVKEVTFVEVEFPKKESPVVFLTVLALLYLPLISMTLPLGW